MQNTFVHRRFLSPRKLTTRFATTRLFSSSIPQRQSQSTRPNRNPATKLITTPIYYVNGPPHIGHAYTSISADVLSRYHRLNTQHDGVFFQTGTDEYGQKVATTSEGKGFDSPQPFVDEVSAQFRSLLGVIDVEESVDRFIRTTEDEHAQTVSAVWNKMMENGYIYKGTYSGWYSVRDECFYNEGELVDGKAPSGSEVVMTEKEESYFFRLSAFEEPLLKFYDENPDFVQPKGRRNEVVSFVKSGLQDLSISRTSFDWGIRVPEDPAHVIYVWIDALTNYLTGANYLDKSSGQWESCWPPTVQMVGKDILRFHAVYWPAMLMAIGEELPRTVFAHGWWTVDGEKMSKSEGNVVDPFDIVEKFGSDRLRYFLCSEIGFGSDGDFSERKLVKKTNVALSNSYGNLVQRTLTMLFKNCEGGIVPPICTEDLSENDKKLLSAVRELPESTEDFLCHVQIHKYVDAVFEVVRQANVYVEEEEPFRTKKTDFRRMQVTLAVLAEAIRGISIMCLPIIPDGASKVLGMLSCGEKERNFRSVRGGEIVMGGRVVAKPKPVYMRLDDDHDDDVE